MIPLLRRGPLIAEWESVFERMEDQRWFTVVELEEAAMRYEQRMDMRKITTNPRNAEVLWVVKEEHMELYKQTETENYHGEPKVATGPNKRFLVVRYGWYAFSFLLAEGEVRGHALNEQAINMCRAMLALEGRDEDPDVLRYRTKYPGIVGMWNDRAGRTPVTLLPGSSSLRSKK